ncbi:PREDICTED: uncharacterized protein LOC109171598 [Ipomoea nil]|uniref:uncharacterized protein LOC109171598 n=1 Tax=Ipomoea nil TaxID=35883 RepID=UPI000901EFF0|nr:PREDICTED: uncharacterized protein LOC109171598 [Ipomoea nil]
MAKCRFWEDCKSFGNSIQSPWIVMGDFNDIASTDEQWRSISINNNCLQKFVDSFSLCGMLDPGYSDPNYTWCRFAGNRVVQLRRLDRMLWNIEAQLAFLEGNVLVLPRVHSNHNPIMFIDQVGRPPDQNARPFRFEAAWLLRSDYKNIWTNVVASSAHNIEGIISSVTKESIRWNKQTFGDIFSRKKRLETRIRGIQAASNYSTSTDL